MATSTPDTHEPGKQAVKFDAGKPRMDLLPARAMVEIAKVFTYGSRKYDDPNDRSPWKQNWRTGSGMSDSQFDAAGDRHRHAHNAGEDFDDESGFLHLAHAASNAIMRLETFMRFPGTDDRDTAQRRLSRHRIALDIDDVIADTWHWMSERMGRTNMPHYNWPYAYQEEWDSLTDDDVMSIPPILPGADLPIEPIAYITARPEHMRDATECWLEDNHFPQADLIMTNDKTQALLDIDATILVDDRVPHVVNALSVGIGAFLMDQPHNQKHDIGFKRIYSLHDLKKKL